MIPENRRSELKGRIEGGRASSQDKIDFVTAVAKVRDEGSLPVVEALLGDTDPLVLYFALQAVVVDYGMTSPAHAVGCWRFLAEDPDEDVRRMAARCLGRILFKSRDLGSFLRLKDILRSNEEVYVKGGVYLTLFDIVGESPREWPGVFLEGGGVFKEEDID